MKSNATNEKNKRRTKVPMNGDKIILFARGKSIRKRPANTRLLKLVDIFRDHYSVSGPFQRNQIIRWIMELLQSEGYAFRKPRRQSAPSTSSCKDDESELEDWNDTPSTTDELWVEACSEEVRTNVARLFQNPIGRIIDASSFTVTHSRWQQQQQQQQNHSQHQQLVAFHQAVSSAIDTTSLAATLRNEEIQQQQQQQQVEALNQAIFSAIDTSSLARDLRDCPSPDMPSLLSTSTSSSSFHPFVSNSSNPDSYEPLELESFLSSDLTASESPIEDLSHDNAKNSSTETATGTVTHARTLLHKHLNSFSSLETTESSSVLPKDGILWTRKSRQIRLLETMDKSIVPVTSFALFPNVQHEALERSAKSETGNDDRNDLSRTIGYTQQQVGSITILRPIVLLPQRAPETPQTSTKRSNHRTL